MHQCLWLIQAHPQHFFSAHLTCLMYMRVSLLVPEPILWLNCFPSSSSLITVRFEINLAEWDPVRLGGLKLHCLRGIKYRKQNTNFKTEVSSVVWECKNGTLVLYIKLTDCIKGWAGFCCLLDLAATWMITHEASYTKELKITVRRPSSDTGALLFCYTCDTLRPKFSWFHYYWFWHSLDYSDT